MPLAVARLARSAAGRVTADAVGAVGCGAHSAGGAGLPPDQEAGAADADGAGWTAFGPVTASAALSDARAVLAGGARWATDLAASPAVWAAGAAEAGLPAAALALAAALSGVGARGGVCPRSTTGTEEGASQGAPETPQEGTTTRPERDGTSQVVEPLTVHGRAS
jgi:hypothetical protein